MSAVLAVVLPLLQRYWPYVLGVALVVGAGFYIYERGVNDERDRAQKAQQEEIDKQRQERQTIEKRNGDLTDDAATQRLRPEPKH